MARQQQEAGVPEVEISCPHCGGSTAWKLLQTLNQCAFCGSILSWPYREGTPDYLVAESMIRNESDLIEVLAMYDAMREASRRRANANQHRDSDPDISFDLGAGFTDTEIYEIKRQRLPKFRLLKWFCVYAPFQLVSSLLAYHVLGRLSGEQKVARSIFFDSEAILPGYQKEWNFRDRGLQLSKQRLNPLATGKWKDPFLATGAPAKEIDDLVRQWTSDRKLLESEIQPITFEGKALTAHRWWVYRPYYFVNAQTPDGFNWYLLDGQFQTIAGMPDALEVSRVANKNWAKLDLSEVRGFEIKIVPFRCPNCGWDIKLQQAEYQLCATCTRLIEVTEEGLVVQPYGMFSREDLSWWPKAHQGPLAWLPFWRIHPSILFEKKKYDDFAELLRSLIPGLKIPQQLKYFYIPAFNSWTVARYDQWSFQFGASMSESKGSPQNVVLHDLVGSDDSILPMTVSKELAASLFPEIMPAFLASAVQARLNTMLLKRLNDAAVMLSEQQLVYAPAPVLEWTGSDPRVQGPKSTIDWMPLKEGNWPPMLQRTVRRWRSMNPAVHQNSKNGRKGFFSL